MLRILLIFLLVGLSLAWSLFVSQEEEYVFLFWFPVAFTATLLFLMMRQRLFFAVSVAAVLGVMAFKIFHQQLIVSSLLFLLPFAVLAFLIERIRYTFDSEHGITQAVHERSLKSLSVLEDRFQKEEAKIKEFQEKVDYIVHLFETAKNFNVCLDFESLLVTLRDSVFTILPCEHLRLIVFPTALSGGRLQSYEVHEGQVRPWLTGAVDEKELEAVRTIRDIQRFDASELGDLPALIREGSSYVSYPLWVFPLKSESENLAALILEGVLEKDFYPYQIVAGQLALQIQKTLLYERVQELALYDGLTQAYVRRHLEQRFEEELRRSHLHGLKLSVLMLDIDHFKTYNDRFGHLIGDRILREIADMIREKVRSIDLIGRYGGEEFILVFPETDTKGAVEGAERIRSAVAKRKFQVYDESLRATVSIGVASFPDDLALKSTEEYNPSWKGALIEMADLALYRAKEDGRNQVKAFSAEMKGRKK